MKFKKYIERSDFIDFVRRNIPDVLDLTREDVDLFLRRGSDYNEFNNGTLIYIPDDIFNKECGHETDEQYHAYLVETFGGEKQARIAKFLAEQKEIDVMEVRIHYSW